MNPKSMPRERLLGHMDPDTREWADGVLTDAARKVVKESSDVHCWIICDGDVDPEVTKMCEFNEYLAEIYKTWKCYSFPFFFIIYFYILILTFYVAAVD